MAIVSRSDSAIRVGIIRCDTHAHWYAPLIEKPDPQRYRKAHRGCHYYFYEPSAPHRPRFPAVRGMRIAKVFDEEDRTRAEGLSEAYCGRPKVCHTLDEVSDGVDLVYIADCNGEGEDHLRLARPGLVKGVPHFIDKPFAYRLKDARRMIAIAEEHGTAVMCASLLRYVPHLARFRTSLANIAPVHSLFIPNYGPSLACLFHCLSIAQHLLGEGCKSVESMGTEYCDLLRLRYRRSHALVFGARGTEPKRPAAAAQYGHSGYCVSAYGAGGDVHTPRIDDYLYPHAGVRIVKMARQLALTKKPPIPYETMLEPVKMIEAARLAHNTGRRVDLEDVR